MSEDFSMEDAGDQFEDDLLKAMQNSLEVNKATKPAATEANPAYKGKLFTLKFHKKNFRTTFHKSEGVSTFVWTVLYSKVALLRYLRVSQVC